MKNIALLIFLAITLTGYSQTSNELTRIYPVKFKDNITLKNYYIRETYKLSPNQLILIGRSEKIKGVDGKEVDEGLKLIYLIKKDRKFVIAFISPGVDESYIYGPSFYQGSGKQAIVCETGSEYFWGADAFLLSDNGLTKLGHINVAAHINNGEYQDSVIPFLQITEKNEELEFSFRKKSWYNGSKIKDISLFVNPGGDEQTVPVSAIKYRYSFDDGWSQVKQNEKIRE